jgi:hypothetical protein
MNAIEKQFSKFREAAQSALPREEREAWRKKFTADVIRLAKKASDREAFIKQLHDDVLPSLGAELIKLGTGSSRAAFGLPFGLVLKVEKPYRQDAQSSHPGERPAYSTNRAEIERAALFPGFIPKVYAEFYKAFDRADKTLNIAIVEAVIPIHSYLDQITEALGSTDGANLGICPETGRIMVMDVGSAWAEGVEVAFLEGTHPLMQLAPFLRTPRWSE